MDDNRLDRILRLLDLADRRMTEFERRARGADDGDDHDDEDGDPDRDDRTARGRDDRDRDDARDRADRARDDRDRTDRAARARHDRARDRDDREHDDDRDRDALDLTDPLRDVGTPRRSTAPLCDEMEAAFREHQARADSVARAFNSSAPRWLDGERLNHYRARLARQYQRYSPAWRSVDLGTLREDSLRVAEDQIFADAAREARAPTSIRPGELVERRERDASGRDITRFYGDPEACWGAFKMPSRRVVGWSGK